MIQFRGPKTHPAEIIIESRDTYLRLEVSCRIPSTGARRLFRVARLSWGVEGSWSQEFLIPGAIFATQYIVYRSTHRFSSGVCYSEFSCAGATWICSQARSVRSELRWGGWRQQNLPVSDLDPDRLGPKILRLGAHDGTASYDRYEFQQLHRPPC